MLRFTGLFCFIIALALFMPVPALTQEEVQDEIEDSGYAEWSAELRGSYRNLFIYQRTDEFIKDSSSIPRDKKMIADLNRLSFSPEISYGENFTFHTDMDMEAIFSNYNRTTPFDLYWRESDYNDFTKPLSEPVYNRSLYLSGGIRNIYIKMAKGEFTGTAGRQQVRFGSSRLWNPLDLLNPFSPVHVEGNDEQKGIDALRIDWYPGESTEFTCLINPVRANDEFTETDFQSSNYAVRLQTGISEVDAALLAAYTAKRRNAGFDFQLTIFDGMLTGVVLWSDPQDGKSYIQCGSGYEYTFTSGLYFLVEYFYNSLPVNDDTELQAAIFNMNTSGVDSGNYYVLANRIITFNSHYLSAAAGYDLHPLLRGELFAIYDFQGGGLFMNFSLKLNAMQNLDLTAGAICSMVNENGRVSDFISYNKKPLLYASADLYF
ncbi:MAG TPA: hypothetical protein PK514_13930 [Spirochaetota bacterium]|nr:hypothetical protein [Spirochaetota bacterium]